MHLFYPLTGASGAGEFEIFAFQWVENYLIVEGEAFSEKLSCQGVDGTHIGIRNGSGGCHSF